MPTNDSQYSLLDRFIIQADESLRTLFTTPHADRAYPADGIDEADLSEQQRKHVAGLMRVNNAGEVSAQALYHGQALTARLDDVRETMQHAADEETDHLNWCQQRLGELDSQRSVLDPFWYAGSFMIGAVAGAIGDKWSLGFVIETEKQVVKHLQEHINKLPADDLRTRAVLAQMKADELAHADMAFEAGGIDLPLPVKILMGYVSKIMTTLAYRL